jgi:cytochrome c oxidase assembly protein subunit 15
MLNFIIACVGFQIMLGGLMAGSHAALHYPTFPTMNGKFFPENIYNTQISLKQNFLENVTFIQFAHRNMAYFIIILILFFWWKNKNEIALETFQWLPYMILLQIVLGIVTLILSKQNIPVAFGVAHQLGALILLTLLLLTRFRLKKSN